MKACPSCNSYKIRQTSSTLTRILLSIYIFLSFFFFTGGVYYEALTALIPFIVPYFNICSNCNKTFRRLAPQWDRSSLFGVKTCTTKFLVGLLPSIAVIALLIIFFPYTGLGRIAYLPSIYLLNGIIIIIGLVLTRNLDRTLSLVTWVIITLLSLILTVVFYPQEDGPHVIKLIFS